jgi:hypothetical protein
MRQPCDEIGPAAVPFGKRAPTGDGVGVDRPTSAPPTGAAATAVERSAAEETAAWRSVAARLGVEYLDRLTLDRVAAETPLPEPSVFRRLDRLMIDRPEGDRVLVAAPDRAGIEATRAHLDRCPDLARRLFVAAPRLLHRAFVARFAPALTRRAIGSVERADPDLSARRVGEPWQIAVVVVLALAWIAAALDLSDRLLIVWTAFFLVLGFLRALIADGVGPSPPSPALAEADLPSCAVLVPLHREATTVPELVTALRGLDYPADRLVVRLVIEADDAETLAVAEAAIAGTPIETVVVEPSSPRTKPKALDFALPTVDSEIVTIFDAEDRPEPDQLRLAAAALAAGPPELAVVQAALEIDHLETDRNWLVRQFEIEYAGLFHGLLPWLAERGLFLPLGGTSNYFRRSALVAVGAWDPHNVTEDVDVALRLIRSGHRLGIVASATHEEAPTDLATWVAQRIRWQKGWMQTWLVHMRRPIRLHRELGLADAIAFHLIVGGQIASALAFLPSLVLIGMHVLGGAALFGDRDFGDDLVLTASLLAHAMGFSGGVILARRASRSAGWSIRIADLASMPVYWALISWAAHRALVELVVAPHRWNKTSHGLASRSGGRPRSPASTAAVADPAGSAAVEPGG